MCEKRFSFFSNRLARGFVALGLAAVGTMGCASSSEVLQPTLGPTTSVSPNMSPSLSPSTKDEVLDAACRETGKAIVDYFNELGFPEPQSEPVINCTFSKDPFESRGAGQHELKQFAIKVSAAYAIEACSIDMLAEGKTDKGVVPLIDKVNNKKVEYKGLTYPQRALSPQELLVWFALHGKGKGVQELKRCAPDLVAAAQASDAQAA